MRPPQVIGIGSLPSTLGRIAIGGGSESDGPGHRSTELFRARTPRVLAHEREPRRTSRAKGMPSDSTESVLSADQFESFLERERSLADRGTRRFSLLVLRREPGEGGERRGRERLADFAQQVRKGLRSTDLVGRMDTDRVEALLTDTEPAGAQVVAMRVEHVGAKLGLVLEQTIYVYPSVVEPSTDDRSPHEGVRSNGSRNGGVNGHREAAATSVAESRVTTNGKALAGHLNGHASHTAHTAPAPTNGVVPGGRWPMEDLWPVLCVPTPWWKRSLDVLFSTCALLVLFPLFVLVALAIRLDSPGPVLFKQLRAGRGAKPFMFYKFRSMTADAAERRAALASQNEQEGPIFKIRKDPRITRVGRLLRRWSIDELPQLWNILKGDISLVGPRSPTLDEVCKYERWQRRRLCITGGITCTWQVSGRSQISFPEWMRLDMRYVACQNPWLDLRLLLLTVPAMISGRGAC